MRKLKLLLAAFALMGVSQAWAQTDVTSTYITNPGFESCTVTTTNAAAGGSAAPLDISGNWTQVSSAAWSSSAVVAYGGTGQVNGASAPSADNAGNSGNALGVSVGWSGTVTYQSSSAVTLPEGYYVLTVNAYNNLSGKTQFKSLNGFVPTIGDSYLSTKTSFAYATWEKDVIIFNLAAATEGKFQIGGQAVSGGSGENAKVFFDNITLKQYSNLDDCLRDINGLNSATYANPVVTDFVVNGTFDSGITPWQRTGTYQNNKTADNQAGAFTGNFYENWNGSAQVNKMYQTIANIPNGTYRLDIAAFVNTLADPNESQYVYANSDKTYLTTSDPTAYEVYTVVTTNQIEIGLEQTTATANWMGIDNVSLRYYGAGNVINNAKNASHKLAWEEAKAAAEAARDNASYTNVGGSERAALLAEIAKSEPLTADGYDAAAADLTSATSTFTAAKAVYDAYAEIHAVAVALSVSPGDAPADAAAAPAATNALNVAVYTATTAANIFDVTAVYSPSWSSFGTGSGQHWSGDGSSYADEWRGDTNSSSRNATVTLPEGAYILMSAGRGSPNTVVTMSANGTTVTFASKGDTGKGIATNGAANFTDGTFANESAGRGWEWRYIPVTLGSETAVTITQTLTRLSGGAWGSFSDFKILKIGVVATADDYTALNSAISTAEAKTLGFEDGQYAPYRNVAAITALAQAKAINQGENNDQETVQAVTTALSGATWTANNGFVAPIYNGMYATVAAGANYPDGWTRTNGWGQMRSEISGTYATAYYNQPGSLQYGNQGVYTMPLAANTAYALTFSYRSHEDNSNTGMTVSVLKDAEGLAATTFEGNGSTSEWKTVTKNFKTSAAGNYVLTLANSGNTWMTNVSLVKATTESVSVSAAGLATYVSDVDLDFTDKDVKAYTASLTGGDGEKTVLLTRVYEVPAGTGLVLKGAEGSYDIPVIASADAIDGNLMVGTLTTSDVAASTDGSYNYMLSNGANGVGFYNVASATTSAAGKAYLHSTVALKDESGAGSRLAILFSDEEPTGIAEIGKTKLANDGKVYNLSGQQVSKPSKGLYIVNGKKVSIK